MTSSGLVTNDVNWNCNTVLESPQDHDDDDGELMMLWLCERDAAATRRLQQVEQKCKCSNGCWVEEETYLRSLSYKNVALSGVEPASIAVGLFCSFLRGDVPNESMENVSKRFSNRNCNGTSL
jgi:hypothetical protein